MRFKPEFVIPVLCVAALASSVSASAVYGDEASFLSAAGSNYSFNAFDDVSFGPSSDLSYTIGDFSYEIGTRYGSGLFNDDGRISTSNQLDSISISFTSGNVNAIAGNFWGSDYDFDAINAVVNIHLSDGTHVVFYASGESAFRGFVSDVEITGMTIGAASLFGAWPSMDNLYVGSTHEDVALVPLPAAGWAGLGMLGALGGIKTLGRRRA